MFARLGDADPISVPRGLWKSPIVPTRNSQTSTVEHTLVGDPLADVAIQSLAELDEGRSTHRLIEAGMNGDEEGMRDAPDALREFFDAVASPPDFYDPAKIIAGARAFHRNSEMFFVGLVLEGEIVGFTTSVAKSFYTTGRLTNNLRRVKQNTRHMVEITLPGGLDREGDGWKLSTRIRLIHAQVRRLLLSSG